MLGFADFEIAVKVQYGNNFKLNNPFSVCAPWNVMLKTLYDHAVNNCLYVDCRPCFRNDEDYEVPSSIGRISAECGNLCGKISRLILNFENGAGVETLTGYKEPNVMDRFLLDHCHFKTIMLIGLAFDWDSLYTQLF